MNDIKQWRDGTFNLEMISGERMFVFESMPRITLGFRYLSGSAHFRLEQDEALALAKMLVDIVAVTKRIEDEAELDQQQKQAVNSHTV